MLEIINRGYVYRAAPISQEVEMYLRQCFGADRKIYNLHVAHLYDYLEKNNYQIGDKLPSLKKMGMPTVSVFKKQSVSEDNVAYLYLVDAFASNEAKQHFNKAITAFNKIAYKKQYKKSALKRQKTLGIKPTFRDLKGMPKFHSRKGSKSSYTTFNQNGNIYMKDDILYLPSAQKSSVKVVGLKLNTHRSLPQDSKIKNVTVTMNTKGQFDVSICVEFPLEIASIGTPARILGLDYSQSHFFVDNEGKKANYPHYYRKMKERLAKEQRILSRRKKGSKRWEKQRLVVSRLQLKVASQRKDWLHKKAYALAKRYDMIVVENLDLRAIGQNKKYAKNQQDNGFGDFRLYLKYKLAQRGKYFIKAPKDFASTQLCSTCGHKNTVLKGNVNIREWDCPSCGNQHDRDINAAFNLKQYGENYSKKEILPQTVVV
ncbi:transposase [Oceanobacillus oncorhynchi subsp. incaldanensis]|uniref:Putative transposase n=1 Tax=Oceanobacillus oncorhynchi TaxID=545501 RepID=A0A0A1MNA4_9BACI|nr:RNA-guided endonuclease TnpB family protein [Oceanobacillus oncorhynchi]GIO20275.1 transposase [Oceanobacillus oncorhynchi subsp. incaldanensis]CEI80581.1 putative transposase [Oceanobacillus oncorhynchi]